MKYKFELKRNIHMYNHLIICVYEQNKHEAICESAPKEEDTIIIWPEDLGLPLEEKEAVINALTEWSRSQEFTIIICHGKRC